MLINGKTYDVETIHPRKGTETTVPFFVTSPRLETIHPRKGTETIAWTIIH